MRTKLLFSKGKKIFEKTESTDADQGDVKILHFVRQHEHSYEFLKLMSKMLVKRLTVLLHVKSGIIQVATKGILVTPAWKGCAKRRERSRMTPQIVHSMPLENPF